MPRTYDIAVLGATPAGLAAARHLSLNGCDVVAIDAPGHNTECPLAEWVGRDLFDLADLPKALPRACRARPFKVVRYHSAALDRNVDYKSRSAAGWFLPRQALTRALRVAAAKAGVKVRREPRWPRIHLGEDLVRITGKSQTRARLLMMAQGHPSRALAELGLPAGAFIKSHLRVAGVDVPVRLTPAWAKLKGILHVVASPDRAELGIFFVLDALLHLRVICRGAADGTDRLSALVARLQEAQAVPGKLALGKARGAVWEPPAGVALEMESHAAKRCLLAGTAGGFAEMITGQTLLPSVRSAILAAETALASLNSRDLQGTLMSFRSSWRKVLVDYLRPPNTSLQLLLPLLFANRRIVGKFTRALLYGQQI